MRGPIFHLLWTMLLLIGGTSTVRAQEISFQASVDRNAFAVGGSIRLTLTLTNGRGSLTPPDLGGLVIVQGPFESTNMQFVNGRMSSSMSRTYVLTATRPGSYTIGSAVARIGQGEIRTDPITVEVVAGTSESGDRAQQQAQQRNADLFVTLDLSRRSAVVGQQVLATYTLYSRYPNLELSKVDIPAVAGAWTENVDLGDMRWEDRVATVNGLQYRVAILRKQLLFPQKPGRLTIGPATVECLVNRTFFNRGSRLEAASGTSVLDVAALPSGAPADQSGFAGRLEMDVSVDRTQVKANEAIELTIKFTGSGNLKLLDAPDLDLPQDFEVYDPETTDRITVNAAGMTGGRTFRYLIIPRHEGTYELPAIELSYFDVEKGAYRSLSADPITVEVAPGDGTSEGPSVRRPDQRRLEVLDSDIRYIRTGDLELNPHGDRFLGSAAFWAGIGSPVLVLLAFLAWRRRHQRRSADASGMRRRKAEKVARQRLKEASGALDRNDRSAFYEALHRAMTTYLAGKLDIPEARVERATVQERLGDRPDAAALTDRAMTLIEACELARFAPVEDRPRKELYEQALHLVRDLEETPLA